MPEASSSAGGLDVMGVADEPDYSTFENRSGLAEDMKFLASMPELCDVTFLVGDTREPVCAVKAVLAARSRCHYVFILFIFPALSIINSANFIGFVGVRGELLYLGENLFGL